MFTSDRLDQGMLAMSRGQAQPKPFDMKEAVDQANLLCSFMLKAANVKFTLLNRDNVLLYGDVGQLAQVIVNIIKNASQAFLPEQRDRSIEFGWKLKDRTVCIEIANNGPEILAEVGAKMMEPFFTTKETGKGTGLGLSLSKKIVEAYGGSLSYSSSRTRTAFEILLPLYSGEIVSDKTRKEDKERKSA